MNTVCIDGRIAKDFELKTTQTGKSVVSFTIAHDDGYGDKKSTDWHNVVAWGSLADMVKTKIAKGYEVVVDGCLKQNSYTDRNGVECQSYEVVADRILFCKPDNN